MLSWKKFKLSDCLTKVERPVEVVLDKHYAQIGIRSHGKGLFHKESVTGEELGNKAVYWVEPDCFVLNIVFAWEQAVGKTTSAEAGMIASHRFPMYRPKDNLVDIDYLISFFMTKRGKEVLEAASPGGAGRNRTLGQERFLNSVITLPPIAEQQKIAEILSTQDRVIELKTKLLEEKKHLKKYLCQVLLSEENLFEGKKILFKELFEFLNNNSYSRAQMNESGTIYNVHYGDILTKYGEILDAKKDEVSCICDNINLSKYDRLQNGDIIFADTAEDLLVGKSTELKNVGNKHIIAGLHTIAARPIKDCFIPGWLGHYTNSPSYRRQLHTCAQGSKVISILRKDINDTIVAVPDKAIQKKVVTVLEVISDEIKKIRIVIEQEKLKKKALMQQLLTGKVRVTGKEL